jgi:hypothetical protein
MMKATRLNNILKNILSGIFASVFLISVNSCSKSVSFLTSSVVPAARGSVEIKVDKNKNYSLDVSVTELAEVSRLNPPRLTYIVWMITDQELTKNIGQLKSSISIISKRLKGSFKTVSSDKPIKIFITAEDDPGIQYPGNQVVLSTDKFQL